MGNNSGYLKHGKLAQSQHLINTEEMDRVIKFRGVFLDKWVYGDLIQDCDDNLFINSEEHSAHGKGDHYRYSAKPGTVCQFTGLKDKAGKEIYEGDILIVYICHGKCELRRVYWWQGGYWTKRVKTYGWYGKEPQALSYYFTNEIKLKVVGNIHDNPELINL